MKAMTQHEQKRLIDLEARIEHGREELGRAFVEIRERRLYRATHATFEDYCRQRWGFTARGVNLRIAASKVGDNLGTRVPAHAASALAGLPADVQREVYERAKTESPEPSAESLRQAAEAWKDEVTEKINREERQVLRQPAPAARGVLSRMGELVGRLEKLAQRLDVAEDPEGAATLAARLGKLVGRLRA